MKEISLPLKIFMCAVVCLAIGGISGIATANNLTDWYATLNKPFFNPPNWIFGPMWTLLYILMGWSVALIWDAGLRRTDVKNAVILFIVQLLLNGLWSIVFFGMQSPGLGLLVILTLWVLIYLCILWFREIDSFSAKLLWPYLAWVTFATLLNAAILVLN